jgi:hypothetical protein
MVTTGEDPAERGTEPVKDRPRRQRRFKLQTTVSLLRGAYYLTRIIRSWLE